LWSVAYTDRNGNAIPAISYANSDTHANSYTDGHRDRNGNSDCGCKRYAYRDGTSNSNTDAHTYFDSKDYPDAETRADAQGATNAAAETVIGKPARESRELKKGCPASEAGRNSEPQPHRLHNLQNLGRRETVAFLWFIFAFIRVIRGLNFGLPRRSLGEGGLKRSRAVVVLDQETRDEAVG
jgi:hypothetical protein